MSVTLPTLPADPPAGDPLRGDPQAGRHAGPAPFPIWRVHCWLLVAGLAVIVFVAALAATPAHAATAINGHCGMHIGKLLRRNQGGSLYNYRTGPKVRGGADTCTGKVRIVRKGMHMPQAGALAWRSYSMPGFSEHNAILITSGTVTVIGCNAVAKGFVAALEVVAAAGTDGLAYPGATAVAGAVGCGLGARELWNLLPDGPDNLRKVRYIK